MSPPKLSRREREKLRQRGEILEAAFELFAEKGYHNVCMHEIAEKSEFAIGTLYKFFQNKEDLYKALILEKRDIFDGALRQALKASHDEIKQLRNYVRKKTELFREHIAFIRLYLAESRGASFNLKSDLHDEIRRGYRDLLASLAGVFASGISQGRFNPIATPHRLALALDSTINAFFLFWIEDPENYPCPDEPDAVLDIFFTGLLAP